MRYFVHARWLFRRFEFAKCGANGILGFCVPKNIILFSRALMKIA